MAADVISLRGEELKNALPALAELRMSVFRQWPYLYDGELSYEQKYLEKFSAAPDALIVVARVDGRIVGASTASPLLGHADEFARPFQQQGYDPRRVFYFGESVLLPDYRGHGIGHAFFDHREARAREGGQFDIATFCGVIRSADDPRRPDSYVPLDAFWTKRGFKKDERLVTQLAWKETGQQDDVSHDMQFWIKHL